MVTDGGWFARYNFGVETRKNPEKHAKSNRAPQDIRKKSRQQLMLESQERARSVNPKREVAMEEYFIYL